MSKHVYKPGATTRFPGVSSWAVYGGSDGKPSYDITVAGRKYSVVPVTAPNGRHRGYQLTVFPGAKGGHAWVAADGGEYGYPVSAAIFRTPQAAGRAAGHHLMSHGGAR